MSRPRQPGSMPSAGTVRWAASAAKASATTTSLGSSRRLPSRSALPASSRTASRRSGSNSESPTASPRDARKVKHMPPPTARVSTLPSRSSTKRTSRPSWRLSTGTTGAREKRSSRLPLGRPRWEQQITLAPLSSSWRRVGTAARTRRSSVTWPCSSRGTLKSLRTRTRLPLTSAWSTVRSSTAPPRADAAAGRPGTGPGRWTSGPGLELAADDLGEVDQPVGVAPLVVVPAKHLDEGAVGLRQRRVEDAGGRVADDVGGDDRVLRVADDAGKVALGGLAEGVVDLFLGGLPAEHDGQVGERAVLDRDAQGDAVELALELGDGQRAGLRRAGGGGDDVARGRAGAPQVLVREVEDHLVVGVGVDGGHEALLDAEAVEQDLGQRHHRVGGAGGIGDDVVAGRVVGVLVDPDDDGDVLVLGRGGDDHLLGAALEVQGGMVPVGEAAGRLDHHVDPEVAPGQVGRVALGEGAEAGPVDRDRLLVVADLGVEPAEGRVVLEQVGQGAVVGEVVDGDDLDVLVVLGDRGGLSCGAEEVAPDGAEAVDAHADIAHRVLLVHARWPVPDPAHGQARPFFTTARRRCQHPTAPGTDGLSGPGQLESSPGGGRRPAAGRRATGASSAVPARASRRRRRASTAPLERGGSSAAPSSARVASGWARRKAATAARSEGRRSQPSRETARSTAATWAMAAATLRRRLAWSALARRTASPRTSRRMRPSSQER